MNHDKVVRSKPHQGGLINKASLGSKVDTACNGYRDKRPEEVSGAGVVLATLPTEHWLVYKMCVLVPYV